MHTAPKTQHQVDRGLLLDVVVAEAATVFQLLARENEALVVWGDASLVLDLGFHSVFEGVVFASKATSAPKCTLGP